MHMVHTDWLRVCLFVCLFVYLFDRRLSGFCGQRWSVLVKFNSVVCLSTNVESPKGLSTVLITVQPTYRHIETILVDQNYVLYGS